VVREARWQAGMQARAGCPALPVPKMVPECWKVAPVCNWERAVEECPPRVASVHVKANLKKNRAEKQLE